MGKTFCKCKDFEMSQLYKTNKEFRCGDFVLKQNFQLLDHLSLSYKVAPAVCFRVFFFQWLYTLVALCASKDAKQVDGNWSKDVHSH